MGHIKINTIDINEEGKNMVKKINLKPYKLLGIPLVQWGIMAAILGIVLTVLFQIFGFG